MWILIILLPLPYPVLPSSYTCYNPPLLNSKTIYVEWDNFREICFNFHPSKMSSFFTFPRKQMLFCESTTTNIFVPNSTWVLLYSISRVFRPPLSHICVTLLYIYCICSCYTKGCYAHRGSNYTYLTLSRTGRQTLQICRHFSSLSHKEDYQTMALFPRL